MATLDIPCEVIKPKKGDVKGVITIKSYVKSIKNFGGADTTYCISEEKTVVYW
jgi:hypothetical protein